MYWSAPILRHKLERLPGSGEQVWNCRRLPKGLGRDPHGDRLFVASQGRWAGFFRLVPEVLFNPEDEKCPYALIFDTRSWTTLPSTSPCRPFRGWTYTVPNDITQKLPP